MKTKHSLALALLAAPALWAATLPRDTVSFGPSDGTTVSKTFHLTSTLSLDDMTYLMNGQPSPMMPDMEMDMNIDQTVAVTDTYDKTGDGLVEKLTRTFDEIAQEINVEVSIDMMGDVQDDSQSGSGTSELEGATVVFSWNEDDEAYDAAFEDGDGDDDLLENLSEDMDLRRLLPDGDVSEEDEWEIELDALIDVLAPGGDLKVEVEMEGGETGMGAPDPGSMTDFRAMMGDLLEGDATGKYVGTREVDGVNVAVIGLTIEINSARDMSEFMGDMMGDQMPEGLEVSLDRVDMEFSFEAEGELLWNLEGGHAHALSLSGDATVTMDMAMAMEMGEQSMDMEMSMEMSGTMTQEMTTE